MPLSYQQNVENSCRSNCGPPGVGRGLRLPCRHPVGSLDARRRRPCASTLLSKRDYLFDNPLLKRGSVRQPLSTPPRPRQPKCISCLSPLCCVATYSSGLVRRVAAVLEVPDGRNSKGVHILLRVQDQSEGPGVLCSTSSCCNGIALHRSRECGETRGSCWQTRGRAAEASRFGAGPPQAPAWA